MTLVEAPVLQPGDFTMDAERIKQMEMELQNAAEMELPEGEEDVPF